MSNRCEDYGIDYPHSPAWCEACWDRQIQVDQLAVDRERLAEARRNNELLEAQLAEGGYTPKPREQYQAPQVVEAVRPEIARVQRRAL